jgi:hypothetical protein
VILNYLGAGNCVLVIIYSSHYGVYLYLLMLGIPFQLKGEAYEKALQNWHHKHDLKRSIETIWQNLQKAWQ